MGAPSGKAPWNAGTSKGWTDKRGYRWVYVTENGKRRARREHRFIMEQHLGRKLEPWEIVHHIDENPSNNDLLNLQVVAFGDHTKSHHSGSRHSYDAKRSMEAFALLRASLERERSINADLYAALAPLIVIALDNLEFMPAETREECERDIATARAALAKARGEA